MEPSYPPFDPLSPIRITRGENIQNGLEAIAAAEIRLISIGGEALLHCNKEILRRWSIASAPWRITLRGRWIDIAT